MALQMGRNLNLTVQDQIRLHLEQYGQKEIPITMEELSNRLHMSRTSVYQAINRLRANHEIDIIKESDGEKDRITGIKLIRLEPSGRTYRRAAERSGKVIRITPNEIPTNHVDTINGIPALEATLAYLQKKLAVEEMKEKALSAGLDTSVIQFEPEPIAEEAILLFKLYTEIKTAYDELKQDCQMMEFDLEAAKRDNEFLKKKLREETQEELRGMMN